MFVEHTRVLEHIFAEIPEIKIEIASIPRIVIDKGVQKPKLNVFNIGRLKIRVVNTAH